MFYTAVSACLNGGCDVCVGRGKGSKKKTSACTGGINETKKPTTVGPQTESPNACTRQYIGT